MMGWFRRLQVLGSTRSRSRERLSRVPSILDSLESRQVLSTSTLSQVVIVPGQAMPVVPPTPYVSVTALPSALVASPVGLIGGPLALLFGGGFIALGVFVRRSGPAAQAVTTGTGRRARRRSSGAATPAATAPQAAPRLARVDNCTGPRV